MVHMIRAEVWLCLEAISLLIILSVASAELGPYVPITIVHSAVAKGAVCLDGSPPAYHLERGFGPGAHNWLIHLEGGGWCNNATTCSLRSKTRLGSSTAMGRGLPFSAILSNNSSSNPDFYNWNRVAIRYCDGSSFTGDVEKVDPVTKLHYRGARVFFVVMEELSRKGMSKAKNALLSGCSAGGLASILHCDRFHSLLPHTNVKCLSDAGYFINVQDASGRKRIQEYYDQIVKLHGSTMHLPSSCREKMKDPNLCFFPQNVVAGISAPLFILNAEYDHWQLEHILAPSEKWSVCTEDIRKCNSQQRRAIFGYRTKFLRKFEPMIHSKSTDGFYINSCFSHCQSQMQSSWLEPESPRLFNTPIATAVGNWFYGRAHFRGIGGQYPCKYSTCHRAGSMPLVSPDDRNASYATHDDGGNFDVVMESWVSVFKFEFCRFFHC